jgi:PAS domain S-box-containing protein
MEEVRKTGQAARVVHEHYNSNGEKRFVEILSSPLYGADGAFQGIIQCSRDITISRQTEKDLMATIAAVEEEKNKSEAIIAALGDGIIIQDTDYKITYQNHVQNDIYGNRTGELCYRAYEGSDTICEDCPVERTFRDGKIHRSERRVITDKGVSYFELTSSPLRDPNGKIIAGIKVVRDITGSKRLEQSLREGENFLESIFASIQDGIGIIDSEMNIIKVNKTAESWYQYALPLVGKKCYEVYHNRKKRCEQCPAQETLVTGNSAYKIVSKHGHGGKEVGWLEIYSYPLKDTTTGQMKGVIEYVRDITERKLVEEELRQSEEKYRLLIESIQEGVFVIQDAKIQFVNEAFANITGYRIEEIIGMDFNHFVAPEDMEMVQDRYSRRQRGEDVPREYEFHGLRKDGEKTL